MLIRRAWRLPSAMQNPKARNDGLVYAKNGPLQQVENAGLVQRDGINYL
jgi:hypothetical protein